MAIETFSSRGVGPEAVNAEAFARHISHLHSQLGIPGDYAERTGLPLYAEPGVLADAGCDMFGREQRLTPEALLAWQRMQGAASEEDIQLLLVSAFRSVSYQADLIRRKLASGRTLDDILSVNAAPGFSEHHTGRAIDIATPDSPPLEVEFEQTAAYAWLDHNARRFGFRLSYPRGCQSAISYEPWHWCFQLDQFSG